MYAIYFYKNYPFMQGGERVPWVPEDEPFGDIFRTSYTETNVLTSFNYMAFPGKTLKQLVS